MQWWVSECVCESIYVAECIYGVIKSLTDIQLCCKHSLFLCVILQDGICMYFVLFFVNKPTSSPPECMAKTFYILPVHDVHAFGQ